MNSNRTIWTWFDNDWHAGNLPVMGSADHGTWLGTLVFDGARRFEGVAPDLDAHCQRLNHSADALGLAAIRTVDELVALCEDGLSRFAPAQAVYIRPMYWSTGFGPGVICADPQSTTFCLCLEEIPMPPADATARLATTHFHRPTLDVATVNAKAACLYPNNARMVRDAIAQGATNALVTDKLGNVAESATSNVFMVRDGEVLTPIPNGTFLNGITRQRSIALLRAEGTTVHECVLTVDDFLTADEVFLTGNIAKVTPVSAITRRGEQTDFEHGPVSKRLRSLYWDWAHSEGN